MVIIVGNGYGELGQIIDQEACISHCANILGIVIVELFSLKLCINSREIECFDLSEAIVSEKEKLGIQTF